MNKRTSWRYVLLFAAVFFLVSCGYEYFGDLKDGTILQLQLPVEGELPEGITVKNNNLGLGAYRAYRGGDKYASPRYAKVPEKLWSDLDQLRQSWCAHPPAFASQTPDTHSFKLAFQCGMLNNTVYYVQNKDLPQPLRDVLVLLPSSKPE